MSMNITSSVAALFVVLSCAACGGNTLDGGSVGDRSSPIAAGQPDAATSTGEISPERVAAAKAACDGPHGPIDPTPTFADVQPRLIGAWYLCSEPNVYYLTKNIEFAADGTYYVLADDGAGGLKRVYGLDAQGSWPPPAGNEHTLWLAPGLYPDFEKDPRRLRLTVATSGFQNWYVPL
jgi:hypothetical protein